MPDGGIRIIIADNLKNGAWLSAVNSIQREQGRAEKEKPMSGRHLILGQTVDFITGDVVADTHDQRIRQALARFLVQEKGYRKSDIATGREIALDVDGKRAVSRIDFTVVVNDRPFMIVIYGPGSLVTRQRPALAAARLVEAAVVPRVVVTNGKQADILETNSGKVVARGLAAIPSKKNALAAVKTLPVERISPARREKEQRILYALDVLTRKECDDFICSRAHELSGTCAPGHETDGG